MPKISKEFLEMITELAIKVITTRNKKKKINKKKSMLKYLKKMKN